MRDHGVTAPLAFRAQGALLQENRASRGLVLARNARCSGSLAFRAPMARRVGGGNSPKGGRQDAGQFVVRAGCPVGKPP